MTLFFPEPRSQGGAINFLDLPHKHLMLHNITSQKAKSHNMFKIHYILGHDNSSTNTCYQACNKPVTHFETSKLFFQKRENALKCSILFQSVQ